MKNCSRIKGIVVEGVDCSGKSTLIRHLKSELSRHGWDVCNLSHRDGDQFERYMWQYVNANRILFDRAHFSEIVYGNEWRKGNHFSDAERKLLDKYVFENFLVIFVSSSETELRNRYKSRDITQIVRIDELGKIQNSFAQLFKNYGNKFIFYEATSEKNLKSIIKYVYGLLDKEGLMLNEVKREITRDNKKQRLLLEGVNSSGKSTIAKLLKVNLVGWSVKTLDYKDEPPFARFLKEYVNNRETIFDRGHFSEIVYGNIFRDGNHFSEDELEILNEFTKEKMKVVFCDPPMKVLNSRIKNITYPKHIHKSRLSQVRSEFVKALDQAGINYLVVDTSNRREVENTVETIRQYFGGLTYTSMGWDSPRK